MNTKKVVLFIVEGVTDETSLGLILTGLLKPLNLRIQVVGTDITSDIDSSSHNIKTKVNEQIKKFKDEHKVNNSDILKVIHLVDTDGTYVDEKYIVVDNVDCFQYSCEAITAKTIDTVITRNIKKAQNMNVLYSCDKISRIPYSMYYLSCNLEHVLHDLLNVPNDEKVSLAETFADEYYGKEKEFVTFISDKGIAVPGTYKETWDFIKDENNSLKRFSNFHLFFSDI